MKTAYRIFAAAVAVLLLQGTTFAAVIDTTPQHTNQPGGISEEPARVPQQMKNAHRVSGRIESVDIKNGTLSLSDEKPDWEAKKGTGFIINENDTTVTDYRDKKFLKLEDLRVGQGVSVEFARVNGRPIARLITVNYPAEAPPAVIGTVFIGEIILVDVQLRELTLRDTPTSVTYRVVVPEGTFISAAQTGQSLRFEDLKVGQWVKVQADQQGAIPIARAILVTPVAVAADAGDHSVSVTVNNNVTKGD